MYKTMGMYGLLNNELGADPGDGDGGLALRHSGILRQASDKLPVELDEAALIDGASPFQLFPPDSIFR